MDQILGLSADPVTPVYEQQAKSLLATARANLARIDLQIEVLTVFREEEPKLIEKLEFATAPIRKLPSELILEIFFHVQSWPDRTFLCILKLTHVYKHWRQLAIRTPRLWTMGPPIKLVDVSADYIATTKDLLNRSSPLPMRICIAHSPKSPSLPIPRELLTALFAVAHRCHTLEVEHHPEILFTLAQLPSGTFPELESLSLNYGGLTDQYPAAEAFVSAPRLRRLFLELQDPMLFPLPWAQLTLLELDNCAPQICVYVLAQCTSVIHATIRTAPWEDQPSISDAPHLLRTLESLDLTFDPLENDDVIVEPFFSFFRLPALRELHLQSFPGTIEWLPMTTTAFIRFLRHSTNLKKFYFHGFDWPSQEMRSILSGLPQSLTDLTLETCLDGLDNSILETLTYSSRKSEHLVPQLKNLELHFFDSWFSEKTLLKMIRSRWSHKALWAAVPPPPVARLDSVSLSYIQGYRTFRPWFEAEMGQFKSEGLKIKVQ